MTPSWEEIEKLCDSYSDIPKEAIFKEDILRTGLSFSKDALRIASGYKPKAYFIFSFDLVPITEMEQEESFRVPEEVCLLNGPEGFRRTIISVRVNPFSPYLIEIGPDGRLLLTLNSKGIANVQFPDNPSYYQRTLANGKPISDISPTIEWGYLLYLTVFRLCQYFGKNEECQFCDINANYRQQKNAGRPYTGVKSVEEIIEALEIISELDTESKAYTVTGGSVTDQLKGKSESEFYAQYPEAIEKKFPGRWISKIVVQALERDEVKRFKDAGVQIYHPNYEVWDPNLFSILCPGKTRYIGREKWIRRVLNAAEIFGPSRVIPNFVAGIEMSKPNGFQDVNDALESTAQGLDFFMSHGVVPRFTTWCPEPMSALGNENKEGAPLEYHVGLLRAWRDTMEKYKLPPPPGYGEPGVGKAVFSVSSFMDVVRIPKEDHNGSVR